MSHYLIQQLDALDNVSVRLDTVLDEAHGESHLESLTLRHLPTGSSERVDTGHAFIFIGAQPRTDWLADTLVRDDRGFVLTGPDLVVDRQRPRRLVDRPRPVAAGGQHPRGLRRRRRAGRLGEAGRVGGR